MNFCSLPLVTIAKKIWADTLQRILRSQYLSPPPTTTSISIFQRWERSLNPVDLHAKYSSCLHLKGYDCKFNVVATLHPASDEECKLTLLYRCSRTNCYINEGIASTITGQNGSDLAGKQGVTHMRSIAATFCFTTVRLIIWVGWPDAGLTRYHLYFVPPPRSNLTLTRDLLIPVCKRSRR